MPFPANIQQANNPWGVEAVYVCFGTEGGPYTGCSTATPLPVTIISGGGGGSNAAAGPTGSAVPADADYAGLNVAGTLQGQTGVSPSGSIYAAQMDMASISGTVVDTNSGTKSNGTLRVVIATDQPTLSNAQPVSTVAAATGGGTPKIIRNLGAATLVKTGATTLYALTAINTIASIQWIQLFDAASAGAVTLGTTVPVYEFLLAATNGQANPNLGNNGLAFVNGLVVASTTAEFGSSASASGVFLNLGYK